ncbi:NAD(+) diphosphatase [Candidatus Fermentibacteria bacterium]|nr:NAD(+) diphosphatase [Candidatus Fermentibacteria bacterium]
MSPSREMALNRAQLLRRNDEWVRACLASPHALAVLVADGKVLASEDGSRPVFVPLGWLGERMTTADPVVLLGTRNDTAYVAVGLGEAWVPPVMAKDGRWVELRQMGALFHTWEGEVLGCARALVYWHTHNRFCGICGAATESAQGGSVRMCTNGSCGKFHFPRTDPAVIVLVSAGEECLLARQRIWVPGRYSAVAGFVEPAESCEHAAAREVEEETGILVEDVRYRFSQGWPFPRSLMIAFRARAVGRDITVDTDELEDARWLSREQIEEGLMSGRLSLPPVFAAGFRLVEEWFDEGGSRLRDLVTRPVAGG